MANLEKPIGGKFLKVETKGAAADCSYDAAILKFHDATEQVTDLTEEINTAVEFRRLALILNDAGADVASNYAYVFNLGAADAHDNIAVGDITGISNKTLVNIDISATIQNSMSMGVVLDILLNTSCAVDGVAYLGVNDYFKKAGKTLRLSKGIHGDIETLTAIDTALAAKPSWLGSFASGGTVGSYTYTAKNLAPGGDYNDHIETGQPDAVAPAASTTYYFNANHSHISYGLGNQSLLTYADGTAGKVFSDQHNYTVSLRCEVPGGDVSVGLYNPLSYDYDNINTRHNKDEYEFFLNARKALNSLRGKRIFMVDKNANKTVNGSAVVDYNSPKGDGLLESKFFDALKNDGLFPGTLPSTFNNQFMAISDELDISSTTIVQQDASTYEVASTAPFTNAHKHVDTNRKVKFAESTKSFITLQLPINSQSQVITK